MSKERQSTDQIESREVSSQSNTENQQYIKIIHNDMIYGPIISTQKVRFRDICKILNIHKRHHPTLVEISACEEDTCNRKEESDYGDDQSCCSSCDYKMRETGTAECWGTSDLNVVLKSGVYKILMVDDSEVGHEKQASHDHRRKRHERQERNLRLQKLHQESCERIQERIERKNPKAKRSEPEELYDPDNEYAESFQSYAPHESNSMSLIEKRNKITYPMTTNEIIATFQAMIALHESVPERYYKYNVKLKMQHEETMKQIEAIDRQIDKLLGEQVEMTREAREKKVERLAGQAIEQLQNLWHSLWKPYSPRERRQYHATDLANATRLDTAEKFLNRFHMYRRIGEGREFEQRRRQGTSGRSAYVKFKPLSNTNPITAYEEDCLRSPHSLKTWVSYLNHKREAPLAVRFVLYERALLQLPASYKLWLQYLLLRVEIFVSDPAKLLQTLADKDFVCDSPSLYALLRDDVILLDNSAGPWERINNCFERCLASCNKFPVIWLLYCAFLMFQHTPSRARRAFDHALRSLPITQHDRIWPLYLKYVSMVGGETAVRVWSRYLKLDSSAAENYIDLLVSLSPPRYAEAARVLASIIQDPNYISPAGKSHYQLWTELCNMVCDHADEIDHETFDVAGADRSGNLDKLNVDKLLRAGIATFTDQVGKLWNSLAKWWILRGEPEKARDVYEEAIAKVVTVRDFATVFDAYSQFEESMLQARIQRLAVKQMLESEGRSDELEENEDDDDLDDMDIEIRLARFEKLMDKRPFLVNDVLLRQNPHNVSEWDKRVDLWVERDNKKQIVETFTKAFSTIVPKKASGKLDVLWVRFATWYEDAGDLVSARGIFEKAIKVPFKSVEQLAEIWCQWADFELRNDELERARDVMGRATAPPRGQKVSKISYSDDSISPQQRLCKSLKVWSKYVDIEEALGTIDSTKLVYEKIIELKIAIPQIFINYAIFLEENEFFEDSFKIYERGVETFGFPVAVDFWNLYLSKFIKRYQGTKLERARDIFEHAIENVPKEYARNFYLMYAKLEEDYGLTRHAMRIYDRATKAVDDANRAEMFTIYIAKAGGFYGLPSTREIYEKAIDILPDKKARGFSLKYADLETKLGEIDRARGVLAYCSQFCDPRLDPEFWDKWNKFEVNHGNEDTFKEMLRIKRSVQAKFNTEVSFISSQIMAAKKSGGHSATESEPNTIAALEAKIEAEASESSDKVKISGFVKATITQPDLGKKLIIEENPDEIAIDDDDDEDMDEDVERRAVPDAVFGLLKSDAVEDKLEKVEKVGALERFKRKK
ncbi:pre-mRNA-splicing factor syf1 [Nowakowskiella sp. JEL0078]|nr:pre-mRNA-splicing factor syf1 [Nowakowskiella sp. JEL0078]